MRPSVIHYQYWIMDNVLWAKQIISKTNCFGEYNHDSVNISHKQHDKGVWPNIRAVLNQTNHSFPITTQTLLQPINPTTQIIERPSD